MIRAATHVHSDWSYDGSWELTALAEALQRRGYDAVLTAEHDRGFSERRWCEYREACAAASAAAGILVVPGIEYSDLGNVVHVPVWGEALPFLGEGLPTGELLAAAADAGGAAVLAHPQRREAWRRAEPSWFEHLAGVEVWNRKYDGWAPSALAAELGGGHDGLVPFFGLDFHTARQFFPLAMCFDLGLGAGAGELVAAMLAGRCQPLALGVDGARFLAGPGRGTARAAEAARRAARPAVRWLRESGSPGARLGSG